MALKHVVAGLVPATTLLRAQSNNDRDGRDKPGHDVGRCGAAAARGRLSVAESTA